MDRGDFYSTPVKDRDLAIGGFNRSGGGPVRSQAGSIRLNQFRMQCQPRR